MTVSFRAVLATLTAVVALLAATAAPASAAFSKATASAAAGVPVTVTNSDAAGNEVSRFDVTGNALDAHDGSILRVGDVFYLYGTSYACGYQYQVNSQFCGFKAYSSPDLVHWRDRGYIVAPGACQYCFRPHVVFNASTGRYVLWADGGGHYLVYTSPSPTGLFARQPDPTLAVGGAVDESLFVDDDGTGYVVHNTTLVAAGLTADMVVERLTADYLTTTGQYVRLGLGDVEAFTVFKRGGVYHALMSDPSCAYCSGGTGEMTATSMLGPWSGAWFDPNGVHQSGRAEPRWRARIVNADSCGGQPLASFPVTAAGGSTAYYFVSDRWNNRAPNESLADFYFGPMSFDASGTLQNIPCVNAFTMSVPGPVGGYVSSPDLDQTSGFDGFRHYCDLTGAVARQQGFVPSRTGFLSTASLTSFQRDNPNAPLILDVVDESTGAVLSSTSFAAPATPWAPTAMRARPDVAVTAGHRYLLRLHSATTSGCYGFEYNDANPYPGGAESYSVSGGAYTAEPARDLMFSTDVSADPVFTPADLPPGFTRCAGESETCAFTGTRVVGYGAGSYRYLTATGTTPCGITAFGGDPAVGVLKSCYVAPFGGPTGSTTCAAENTTCAFTGTAMVAYGANGAFVYHQRRGGTPCTTAAFGADPLPGVAKACYLLPAAPPGTWTPCAAEGATCAITGTQTVGYGTAGSFVTTRGTGSLSCGNATFGADPLYGVAKTCYLRTGAPSGFTTTCAAEGGTCSFSGFRTVAYGADGEYSYASFTTGVGCGTASFGTDPLPGVVKACYLTP